MSAVIFTLVIIFNINFILSQEITKKSDNYGPFTVEYDDIVKCAGPKRFNLTTYEGRIKKVGDPGIYKAYFNLTTLTEIKVEKVYIRVYTMKKNRINILWNYRIERNVCQHFLINRILEETLHEHNCLLKKKIYLFEVDLSESAKLFLGTSFFYGEIHFKSVVLAAKGNVLCFVTTQRFLKKK